MLSSNSAKIIIPQKMVINVDHYFAVFFLCPAEKYNKYLLKYRSEVISAR
ncbi:hypothetical protein SpAn4DRAFT_0127 [Sporomusa ovata]|uniref:Uncharacterized protein n=1 Tax=Sporomusa ovata TaxID=2378 RepID=A0A0U1L294_9FIRM|nr:hypothetical protein SpAn4DRAFT_0127 [Sporomusa ovata]